MTLLDSNESSLGAVAIGRNEGERLRDCLRSLVCRFESVVYVDSGSTDDSFAVAGQVGVVTVALDTSLGFTAARARNAGFRHLLEIAPNTEFVQFIDGDCEVVGGWIDSAVEFIQSHEDVAVVCGRRREREPQRNWYHRLAEMEWNTLPGESQSCGGDALVRVAAIRAIGGYRESLIAGEEPELCTRLRKAGWKVWRLDRDMTLHDIHMMSFRQWWWRAVRAGHAYTEAVALHCSIRERQPLKKVCSIWFWAFLPLAAALLAWPTYGYSLLVLCALYLLLLVKIIRYRATVYHDTVPNASLYAFSCVVAKWPQAIGSLMYLWNRVSGSRADIIEYRSTAASDIVDPRQLVK